MNDVLYASVGFCTHLPLFAIQRNLMRNCVHAGLCDAVKLRCMSPIRLIGHAANEPV
jgi:hypothetical protein